MKRSRRKIQAETFASHLRFLAATLCLLLAAANVNYAQRKRVKQETKSATPASPLTKLRDEYIEATKNYKASLVRLRATYEKNVSVAEGHLAQSQKLYSEGLISKNTLTESEQALISARNKVTDVQQQLESADTQIANVMVEAETEAKIASMPKVAKGSLITTTAYIRYNGTASWNLSDSWKVQKFFEDAFKRPLPIGVFGQGAIHDRWRLDHHNAMDVSLNPDGAEGQALIGFMRANGIPFSAFRQAIPGTATGPHIHVGRPSHRF